MTVTPLVEDARPAFQAAFEAVAMGEDLTWDLQWVLLNTDKGPMTVFHVYVHCAALFHLGAKLQHTFFVPIAAQPAEIERIVRTEVNNLFTQRRQRIQQVGNGGLPGDDSQKLQLPGT